MDPRSTCVAHNDILQTRCKAGELNVPDDEPMLVSVPPCIITPSSTSSNNVNLIQFASTFSQFSPNSQSQALNLINCTSAPILPPKILFPLLHELPALSSSTDFSYGIHPFIVNLAKNKVHIPLTLFTSNSTRKLHTETTSLKQNTIYNSAGLKCHIINLLQFLDELKIDVVDWHESWQCYMTFLDTHTVMPRSPPGGENTTSFSLCKITFNPTFQLFSCLTLQKEPATPLIPEHSTRRATCNTSKLLKLR